MFIGYMINDYVWRSKLSDVTPTLNSDLSPATSFTLPPAIQLICILIPCKISLDENVIYGIEVGAMFTIKGNTLVKGYMSNSCSNLLFLELASCQRE